MNLRMRTLTAFNSNIMPSLNDKSLLDKFPNETTSLDDLLHNKNSSKYYDVTDFSNLSINNSSFLGILYSDISSLAVHHDEFVTLLSLLKYKCKVIAITETIMVDASMVILAIEVDS